MMRCMPARRAPSRSARAALAVAVALAGLAAPAGPGGRLPHGSAADAAAFTLVGSDPLDGRGMNSALALDGNVAYVGSRTDAGPAHAHPGLLVVDVSEPAHPRVAGEVGAPAEGLSGYTARELRIWPQQHLLVVQNMSCSASAHACDPRGSARAATDPYFAFFDISDALHPRLVSMFHPPRTPHEFFLWVDPARPAARALMLWSSPTAAADPAAVTLTATDISGWRANTFSQVATYNPNPEFSAAERRADDVRLHSLSLSPDGSRAYLAALGGGILVLDSGAVARGAPGADFHLLTPVEQRVHWGSPGAHSAVAIPGTTDLLVTDEVYGTAGMVNGGCPWGLARTVDIADPARPRVLATVGTAEDQRAFCAGVSGTVNAAESFSPHNPTVLPGLALVSWHSAGLVALDLSDPVHPAVAAAVRPAPLDRVATEDPVLGGGPDHQQAWSYPIVRGGLIYVVDIRNGLLIYRYSGPGAAAVAATTFREGNSNVGDVTAPPAATPVGATPVTNGATAAPPGVTAAPAATPPVTVAAGAAGSGTTSAVVAVAGVVLAVAAVAALLAIRRRRRSRAP